MERSLKAHIEELTRTVLQLNDQLMQEDDVRVRNSLETRARAADQALQYFRAAIALEETLRQNPQ